jgi:prespore-specific regulator
MAGLKGRKWTEEEDRILRESVLQSIIQGGTQIEAFEKVGKKLGRTPGACGFRWNAVLRQKDPDSYSVAKKKRVFRQLRKRKGLTAEAFSQVLDWMRKAQEDWVALREEVNRLSQKISVRQLDLERLLDENRRLKEEKDSYDWYQHEVKDKYQDLLQLFRMLQSEVGRSWQNEVKNAGEAGTNMDTGQENPTYNKDEA